MTMFSAAWSSAFILILGLAGPGWAWHGTGNTDFHCWPLSANSFQPTPWVNCKGIIIKWIMAPPKTIRAKEPFNVSYSLAVDDSTFWTWAVTPDPTESPFKHNIFTKSNGTGYSNASDAQNWCYNQVCPSDYRLATEENCCIHHVNVHSCPFSATQGGLCGPWIPPLGSFVTHSEVLVGPLQQLNWTSGVSGLYETGKQFLIAHFKFANMHLALNFETNVLPRAVCGNGICEIDENESCESCIDDCGRCPLTTWQLGLIIFFGVLAGAGIIVPIAYLRIKANKQLWDETWIINWDDVQEDNTARGFMGSAISINADAGDSGAGGMAASAAKRQLFTKICLYQGKTLAVKPLVKKHFMLTKATRKEVSTVRALDHLNLVRFLGMSIEVPHVAIFSEYCPKGSLNDVLLNEDVPISWAFRFSFATDVARGLSYLHQHKVFHGHLKSQNCIIDDRWTVKIADYGLPNIRIQDIEDDEEDEELLENEEMKERTFRPYKAPEMTDMLKQEVTPSVDVYAFGVILIEIATRNDPYGDDDHNFLPEGWFPTLPEDFVEFQSDEPEDSRCPAPADLAELVEQCMDYEAEERPTAEKAKKTLQHINPNKQSAVDLMMAMMEKYSKHLEAIVGERTQELVVEKQKTDRLLYSMLPISVADNLKLGIPIEAEMYDECTIYFSDIVGFTNLSGGSSALQVVALLNKLYTVFDSVIDRYDVYKVETIGDAYMVVSGVPNINGHDHAREMSLMSIDLVKACENFVIPHKPGEALNIRIGLHTGPVCAGVVGLKMPRYCLFGDTVNTASRMESNGEAWKIHCSSTTHDMLVDFHKGFRFEKRGVIPIKGKGDMTTWWLLGREVQVIDEEEQKKEEQDEKKEEEEKPRPGLLQVEPAVDLKQRKISTVSTGGDSGFGEKDAPEIIETVPETPAFNQMPLPTPPQFNRTRKVSTDSPSKPIPEEVEPDDLYDTAAGSLSPPPEAVYVMKPPPRLPPLQHSQVKERPEE